MEKPEVGTWIRVTTDYTDARKTFAATVPRTHTHIGKVMTSAEWEGENTFALLTTEGGHRIRTIDLAYVSSLETYVANETDHAGAEAGAAVMESREADKTYEIKGSTGNIYVVTKINSVWACNCVAGQNNRSCKHLKEAKEKFKAEQA